MYDAIGHLTSRQFGGVSQTPLRIDYTYNANGQVTHITRYGNLAGTLTVATTDTTYNVEQQITNLLHKNGAGTTISSLTFTYDAQFRLQSQNTDGTIATYVYDSTDQVTSDGRTTVQYDATGNRTTVTVSGATSNYSTTTGNRLQADGTWDYVYDTEGNMTSKYHRADDYLWIYEYDQANHLTHAYRYDSGATLVLEAAYKYDAFGNRIEKSVDNDGVGAGAAVATRYAYDQWNPASPTPIGTDNAHVWAESTAGGSLTTRYLYGDATDDLLARIDSGTPAWYLKDHQGSIRKIIDNNAAVQDSLTYDAFGNIISETTPANRGNYAWTSREFDVETGLQYNRARYYDATTSRWISQDPLGFDAGDSNLYRYVMNRPTMATDPSGLYLEVRNGNLNEIYVENGSKKVFVGYKVGATVVRPAVGIVPWIRFEEQWRTNVQINWNAFFGQRQQSEIEKAAIGGLVALKRLEDSEIRMVFPGDEGLVKRIQELRHDKFVDWINTPSPVTSLPWDRKPGQIKVIPIETTQNLTNEQKFLLGIERQGPRIRLSKLGDDALIRGIFRAVERVQDGVEEAIEFGRKTLANKQVQAIIKIAGAIAGAAGGFAMMIASPEPGPVSRIAGFVLVMHSADTLYATLDTLRGNDRNTFTHMFGEQFATWAGAETKAGKEFVGTLFDMGVPLVAGAAPMLTGLIRGGNALGALGRTARFTPEGIGETAARLGIGAGKIPDHVSREISGIFTMSGFARGAATDAVAYSLMRTGMSAANADRLAAQLAVNALEEGIQFARSSANATFRATSTVGQGVRRFIGQAELEALEAALPAAEPMAFGGVGTTMQQRVQTLLEEAARLTGKTLNDLVDVVRVGETYPKFTVENGRRVIAIPERTITGGSRSKQLLDAIHELVHAEDFDILRRTRYNGNLEAAWHRYYDVASAPRILPDGSIGRGPQDAIREVFTEYEAIRRLRVALGDRLESSVINYARGYSNRYLHDPLVLNLSELDIFEVMGVP